MECRALRAARWALPFACLLGIGLTSIPGCSGEKKATVQEGVARTGQPKAGGPQYDELKFVPDPALLGFVCEDKTLGIQIAPPRGWVSLDPDSLAKLQAQYDRMVARENPFVARPVRIFTQDQRLFMFVSQFPSWPVVLSQETAIAQYRQQVMLANPDAQMMDGFFRSGEITGYRLLVMSNEAANFRVIVFREGRAPVQVNYLVPRGLYSQMQKAIEASIGSIKNL
jgi:hypothetical protein